MSPDEIPSNEYKDYDVFYIHPTGYFQPHWNAPLEPESAAFERTESHLATQASEICEEIYRSGKLEKENEDKLRSSMEDWKRTLS